MRKAAIGFLTPRDAQVAQRPLQTRGNRAQFTTKAYVFLKAWERHMPKNVHKFKNYSLKNAFQLICFCHKKKLGDHVKIKPRDTNHINFVLKLTLIKVDGYSSS